MISNPKEEETGGADTRELMMKGSENRGTRRKANDWEGNNLLQTNK
jgi:hypothetical protein